ncbi:hypothetical protein K3G63_22145 [Hymenobacter sp. HSC-4F20]|uniref:hypothetical protein n=1 Tax=Hymenobacter sp. HSC-4F20 TaxID=2864135 RepID=UPI001C72C997|nr:hypothetical protein [Hymenobacter sp. HSC-4F20]MBX0293163.1 hypothetical protein [Hymenobacter sp. HSC-4F20]
MLSSQTHTFANALPYDSATPAQREQALVHTRQLLQSQLPGFNNDQWVNMFTTYAPQLYVETETGAVILTEDVLVGFANWVNLHRDINQEVPLYGHETYYLARNLVSYSQDAKDLLTSDPDLSRPESIDVMRALFSRLSVGNSVAERVYHTFEQPIKQTR